MTTTSMTLNSSLGVAETFSDPNLYAKARVAHQNKEIDLGDRIPSVRLSFCVEAKKRQPFLTDELLSKKITVLFSVPKAFTPTCSNVHYTGFVEVADELYKLGISTIACVAVNTPDEMYHWPNMTSAETGKPLDPARKISMIPDFHGQFISKLGIGTLINVEDRNLGFIAKRGVFIFVDGKLVHKAIESDPGTCGVSHAKSVVSFVKKLLQDKGIESASTTVARLENSDKKQ